MENPLVETAKIELNKIGIYDVMLVKESYSSENFGNAEAVFQFRNIIFLFLRDRDQDFLDLGSVHNPNHYYLFDDVSVIMGWQNLDDIIKHNKEIDFDKPPSTPISLSKVLEYIKNDIDKLNRAFSDDEITVTNEKLKVVERKRAKAVFGYEISK